MMINLLMLLALTPANSPIVADIQPCIWPKCVKPVEVVQFQPCIWPKCAKDELNLIPNVTL